MAEPSPQIKVGVLVIITFIILAALLTWKSDILVSSMGYGMVGSFENVEGLTRGSEVRYRGFKVGKVTRIDPSPTDVRIYCVVDRRIKFPADSHLRVAFDGIVGLKFLEIRPGESSLLYKQGEILKGVSTAGIVDFIDIGTQNLQEIKKVLGNMEMQESILSIATQLRDLTRELRSATSGLTNILADTGFQEDVKGTIGQTHKTLSSANKFFESMGSLNVKADAYANFGGLANEVRATVDLQGEKDFMRIGVGEGAAPGRAVGLQDLQLARQMDSRYALRLGLVNNTLGGGIDFNHPNGSLILSGDLYNINATKPNLPSLRLTFERGLMEHLNLMLRADNVLNTSNINFLFGLKLKSTP